MFKGWIINQSSLMLNDPNTHSKKMKNLPHPDSVTTSKIIVDRNKVTPFAFEGVYIKRERGGQCLSFTCTHFGNHTEIQNNSTHELDIKVSLAKRSFRGFSNHRKRFIQKTVNASPLCNHLTKLNVLCFKASSDSMLISGSRALIFSTSNRRSAITFLFGSPKMIFKKLLIRALVCWFSPYKSSRGDSRASSTPIGYSFPGLMCLF